MNCELLPCGHCKSMEVDDQCGLPEHRYCAYCEEEESALTSGAAFTKLYSGIQAALKELGVPQPGYPAPVANAVEILKKAVADAWNPNTTKEKP